jgi:hypothetical protein
MSDFDNLQYQSMVLACCVEGSFGTSGGGGAIDALCKLLADAAPHTALTDLANDQFETEEQKKGRTRTRGIPETYYYHRAQARAPPTRPRRTHRRRADRALGQPSIASRLLVLGGRLSRVRAPSFIFAVLLRHDSAGLRLVGHGHQADAAVPIAQTGVFMDSSLDSRDLWRAVACPHRRDPASFVLWMTFEKESLLHSIPPTWFYLAH